MTSVQNHQPLLSGSKYISFILIFFVLFSCGNAKKAQQTHYPNGPRPETGIPKKKKDPVVITKSKTDTIPTETPTTSSPNMDGMYADGQVNVTLMLPFMTNKFSETATDIYPKSEIAIQFYGGFKMAMDEANFSDAMINVNVVDSKASFSETMSLMNNPSVSGADIIIGPFRKKNAKYVAEQAVKDGQVMFSPFKEIAADALSGKGFVVQTFIGLDSYMTGIVNYLVAEEAGNVVVLKRKNGKDNRAVLSLRKAYAVGLGTGKLMPLKEMEVDDEDMAFEKLKLRAVLSVHPNTVFIIPVWKGPNYITSIVRKIFVSRNQEEDLLPVVVGMPQWLSFKNMDFQKLNALNTLIPTADVVYKTKSTTDFSKKYFNTYKTFADKNAYKGYDVGKYLLQFVQSNTQGAFAVPNSEDLFLGYQFGENNLASQPVVFKNKEIKILRLENFKLVE